MSIMSIKKLALRETVRAEAMAKGWKEPLLLFPNEAGKSLDIGISEGLSFYLDTGGSTRFQGIRSSAYLRVPASFLWCPALLYLTAIRTREADHDTEVLCSLDSQERGIQY
jgi:hypothetical protein